MYACLVSLDQPVIQYIPSVRHFFVHGICSIMYFSGSSVSAPDNIILYQLIKTIYMAFPHHEKKSAAET